MYTNLLIDVLADAYTLGDGSKSVLQKAISAVVKDGRGAVTPTDILNHVMMQPDKERVRGWKISVERALRSLEFGNVVGKDTVSQENLVRNVLRSSSIIELDGLDQSARKFLIPMLCLWIYYSTLASEERERLKLVVVLEEAHNVLYGGAGRSKETVMEMFVRQCREMGIAVIIVDQHPHLISKVALGNCYTSMCFNLKDPSDITRAADLSLVGASEKRHFSMLPVGQAIVKLQDRWRLPFLVKVPLVQVRKGAVTDDVLARLLKANKTGSGRNWGANDEFEEVRRILVGDRPLRNEELEFLEDVLKHRDDGVKARYKRLGWSVDKGNEMKHRLISMGWLDAEVVRMGNSRKVLLRVSKNAGKLLGCEQGNFRRESVAHEYWRRFWADSFRKKGFDVEVEAPRYGGRVDILATKTRERIGVEIETGKSNVIENVKRGLLSKLDAILVVATDDNALTRIEKSLGVSGLIIPGRVIVVLRDHLSDDRSRGTCPIKY